MWVLGLESGSVGRVANLFWNLLPQCACGFTNPVWDFAYLGLIYLSSLEDTGDWTVDLAHSG